MRVRDLVLGGADVPSFLAASVSMVAERLEDRIDDAAANRVHWGSHFALVATMLHFLELKTDLEVLGSRRNADLTEGKPDAH
jgi:hypothetical protein